MSVIERKIAMMQQEESAKCAEEPLGLNDSSEPEGYRLIDVSCIKVLMSALLCSECVGSSLERTESGKGIHFEFVVLCTTCGEVARALHSVNIGDTRLNELAARINLSARDSGVSFTKLSHLFTGINLPPSMCLKTAKKVAAKVHDAAVTAAGKVMRSAAQSVRKAKIVAKDELLDVCVPFDGTWHKRGHTSHFGGRCGAGLESLKKVKGLGGKGKLTNIKIKKPTNYYACALKDTHLMLQPCSVKCMLVSCIHTLLTRSQGTALAPLGWTPGTTSTEVRTSRKRENHQHLGHTSRPSPRR
ncbi:hypothetical protein HPB47_014864 [Ixodes persulcatus]|uniref:Uncharacterized protein n=1 Tax=Ixodes persulcatus TaxID=34615 RepID=A0AC60QUX4_IXOPE|nr:hypothetical protein HPB47_014864 [Ixodes persulcatus]